MMRLRAIAAVFAVAGTMGFAALGLGSGMANATPSLPETPGIPWQQDDHDGHGHGHGWGGDGGRGGDWGGGNWGNPGWGGGWGGPFGCISGPVGWGWAVG